MTEKESKRILYHWVDLKFNHFSLQYLENPACFTETDETVCEGSVVHSNTAIIGSVSNKQLSVLMLYNVIETLSYLICMWGRWKLALRCEMQLQDYLFV